MFALILPFIYVIYSVYIPMIFQSAVSLIRIPLTSTPTPISKTPA